MHRFAGESVPPTRDLLAGEITASVSPFFEGTGDGRLDILSPEIE